MFYSSLSDIYARTTLILVLWFSSILYRNCETGAEKIVVHAVDASLISAHHFMFMLPISNTRIRFGNANPFSNPPSFSTR